MFIRMYHSIKAKILAGKTQRDIRCSPWPKPLSRHVLDDDSVIRRAAEVIENREAKNIIERRMASNAEDRTLENKNG